MKFKKALKLSLAVALVFGSASTLVGCNKDDDTVQKTEEEKIYDLYVSYMSAQGETPLTYEEWYATIKGAKGEKGDKGDKGEKGDKGDVGATGKNGATWHYGTASTPSANLGVAGDFYFNTSTQAIYIKDASGWGTPVVIEDGQDAVAPQIRINPISKKWEVSIDGGVSWETTTVVAEGKNGEKGNGIVSISKTNTIDNIDTYTITYSDGTFTTFSVVNGLDGEDGKDGTTWHTGEGAPTLQENLEAKEGDFYFDSTDSAIYLFNGTKWTLQVDLVENKQEGMLTLEAGVYEGNLSGFPFSMEVVESEGGVYIESLTVEGLPDGVIKENSFSLDVNDNNEVVLLLEVFAGEDKYEQTIRYFKLVDGYKLELSLNDEEIDLLKGIYMGSGSLLTLSNENFALSYNGFNLKGTWRAVDGDRESGEYLLELNLNGKIITVNVNYFNRGFNLSVEDFSGVYTSHDDILVFNFKENAVLFNNFVASNVDVYTFNYDNTKLYIEFDYEVEEGKIETVGFVIDYLSSTISQIASYQSFPFVGEILFLEDEYGYVSMYQKNEGVLEDIDQYYNFQSVDGYYLANVNLETGNINIFDYDNKPVFEGPLTNFDMTSNVWVYDNGQYHIELTLDENTLAFENMVVNEYVVAKDVLELRNAIEQKEAYISLQSGMIYTLDSSLKIMDQEVVINLNGATIDSPEDTKGNGIFLVYTGAKLTINGDGIINSVGRNNYSIAVWAYGGEVVINGGTFTNEGASGSDPVGDDYSHYDLIYVNKGGKIVINGGDFRCETPKWTLNVGNGSNATIVVKGGTFNNFNPEEANTDDNGLENNPVDYVADGYTVVAEGDVYQVVEMNE